MDLIGLNPHAIELICLTQVLANKIEIFVHSSTRFVPYVHPRLDSILGFSGRLSSYDTGNFRAVLTEPSHTHTHTHTRTHARTHANYIKNVNRPNQRATLIFYIRGSFFMFVESSCISTNIELTVTYFSNSNTC